MIDALRLTPNIKSLIIFFLTKRNLEHGHGGWQHMYKSHRHWHNLHWPRLQAGLLQPVQPCSKQWILSTRSRVWSVYLSLHLLASFIVPNKKNEIKSIVWGLICCQNWFIAIAIQIKKSGVGSIIWCRLVSRLGLVCLFFFVLPCAFGVLVSCFGSFCFVVLGSSTLVPVINIYHCLSKKVIPCIRVHDILVEGFLIFHKIRIYVIV